MRKKIELLKQEAAEKFASGAERLIEMQRLGMTPVAEPAMRAYRAKDGEGLSGKAMDMLETLYEMPGSTLSAFGQTLMECALIIAVAGLAFFFTKGPAVATLVMGMGAWVVSRRRRTFETLALWLKRWHRGRYTSGFEITPLTEQEAAIFNEKAAAAFVSSLEKLIEIKKTLNDGRCRPLFGKIHGNAC